MLAIQVAIGAANDLADEAADRGRKPGKPLPRGLISRRAAAFLAGGGLVLGVVLSAVSGAAVAAVALAGAAIGLAYDRWLKGTAWSWLPFALGIPLLPVYAWLGAGRSLPSAFLVLIPVGVVAGAALALANLLADVERDRAAGDATAAVRLGAGRTWLVAAGLHGVVIVAAAVSLIGFGGGGPGVVVAAAGALAIAGGVVYARRESPLARERAWELEAVGIGLLAAGWVAAVAEAGAL